MRHFWEWWKRRGIDNVVILVFIAVLLIAGVVTGWCATPRLARPVDSADIHYFRDDASQICFAYVHRTDFKAMTEIDCGKVRW